MGSVWLLVGEVWESRAASGALEAMQADNGTWAAYEWAGTEVAAEL